MTSPTGWIDPRRSPRRRPCPPHTTRLEAYGGRRLDGWGRSRGGVGSPCRRLATPLCLRTPAGADGDAGGGGAAGGGQQAVGRAGPVGPCTGAVDAEVRAAEGAVAVRPSVWDGALGRRTTGRAAHSRLGCWRLRGRRGSRRPPPRDGARGCGAGWGGEGAWSGAAAGSRSMFLFFAWVGSTRSVDASSGDRWR